MTCTATSLWLANAFWKVEQLISKRKQTLLLWITLQPQIVGLHLQTSKTIQVCKHPWWSYLEPQNLPKPINIRIFFGRQRNWPHVFKWCLFFPMEKTHMSPKKGLPVSGHCRFRRFAGLWLWQGTRQVGRWTLHGVAGKCSVVFVVWSSLKGFLVGSEKSEIAGLAQGVEHMELWSPWTPAHRLRYQSFGHVRR